MKPPPLYLATFVLATTGLAQDTATIADNPATAVNENLVQKATTGTKSSAYHVVFSETIRVVDGKATAQLYGAQVEVFIFGKSKGKFKATTIPNDGLGGKHSVIFPTSDFPGAVRGRFYTWRKGMRAAPRQDQHCLRLSHKVPTISVSDARTLDKLAGFLSAGNLNGDFQYATSILVHKGGRTSRNSAGCLTILPSDAPKFFGLFPEGATGTMEVRRTLRK